MPAPAALIALASSGAAMAGQLWTKLGGGKEGGVAQLKGALRAAFGPEEHIRIKIDDHERAAFEGGSASSETARRGAIGDDEWLEYAWPMRRDVGDGFVKNVRWRLYRSGLVIFNAELDTEGGGLDGGEILGHRVELRDRDGMVLCALYAGFFVRRRALLTAYASTAVIDNPALSKHFDELPDAQTGQWFAD